jgi:hypothetical protein
MPLTDSKIYKLTSLFCPIHWLYLLAVSQLLQLFQQLTPVYNVPGKQYLAIWFLVIGPFYTSTNGYGVTSL